MRKLSSILSALGLVAVFTPLAAQEATAPAAEELEVTMQIIVDPAAKVPDSVVRRIKLPLPAEAREASAPVRRGPDGKPETPQPPPQAHGELGKEVSERAREMAREAAENREELGRSIAEEARRTAPPAPPAPPVTPPGRP